MSRKGPTTWATPELVAGAGFEPATFGFEVLAGHFGWCRLVPEYAVDLRFRLPARPFESRQNRLVTARPLEDPLEVMPPERPAVPPR